MLQTCSASLLHFGFHHPAPFVLIFDLHDFFDCHLFRLFFGFFLRSLHGSVVVFRRFPLLKGNRSGRAARQAVAKSVAVVLPDQLCLSIDNVNGSLVTGCGAQTAAVAFFLVYLDDFPQHIIGSFLDFYEWIIL